MDKKSLPKVIIIVANYNGMRPLYKGRSILWHAFSTLKKTSYQNYELILADDFSTDGSIEYVKKNFPYVNIVKNKENGGFSKNNNNAIRYALNNYNLDYVLLLNNDVIITSPDWLDKMVSAFEERKGVVGMEGCRLIDPKIGSKRGQQEKDIKYVGGVIFACVLIHKDTIRKIGLLDENFFMGHEDTDYAIRLKRKGLKVLYNGEAEIVHLEGFSSANAKDKDIRDTSFRRNQVNAAYLFFKDFGLFERIYLLFLLVFGGFLTIEDENHTKKITNLRIKDRPLWRINVSINSIFEGYRLLKRYQRSSRTS